MNITEIASKYEQKVIELRELIHMYPEDGFAEFKTSKLVADTLTELGVEVQTGVAKTGVVGLIRGGKPGKTVLLRGDMDALFLEEKADVPYKSKVPGMMHGCGHDGHTAGLLGAAMILNEIKDELCGNVKLCFQPAEERDGGAEPMIAEGILENPKVDAAIGGHLWGSLKEGELHVREGVMMGCPCHFDFTVTGKGGHGAMPHQANDPVVMTSQIITSLQTIVSRYTNPLEPVVLSIGQIHAGDAFNVIPNDVWVQGSVRVLDTPTKERVEKQMEDIIKGITQAYGATYEFNFRAIYPPVMNDSAMVKHIMSSSAKVLGEENVRTLKEPNMGGEDYSFFGQYVPSVFFFLGIGESEEKPAVHHNPYFCWNSNMAHKLSKVMAQGAIDYLNS